MSCDRQMRNIQLQYTNCSRNCPYEIVKRNPLYAHELTGNAREERRGWESEGERRWERVVRATCSDDEAANFWSKRAAAGGSSAAARDERNFLWILHTF